MRTRLGRGMLIGVSAAVVLSLAAPVSAQLGSQGALKGKVVDESGKPVPDAELSFDLTGQYTLHKDGKTDSRGEFLMGGLAAAGQWTVTAKKGNLQGRVGGLEITVRGVVDTPNIVLRAAALPSADPKIAEAERKAAAELESTLAAATAAFNANNYDEAIAKLTEVAGKRPCSECYVRIGEAYVKKNELDKAEQAYLKGAELNPKSATPYDGLASLYNQQRKFEEAGKAAAKASELRGGGAAGGAGGDATSEFNAGVISWNQTKVAEARAHFERAVALDPKMAEAHYQLGMAYINENKLPEAKKALETYVQLAPTGPNAETAKAILGSMK